MQSRDGALLGRVLPLRDGAKSAPSGGGTLPISFLDDGGSSPSPYVMTAVDVEKLWVCVCIFTGFSWSFTVIIKWVILPCNSLSITTVNPCFLWVCGCGKRITIACGRGRGWAAGSNTLRAGRKRNREGTQIRNNPHRGECTTHAVCVCAFPQYSFDVSSSVQCNSATHNVGVGDCGCGAFVVHHP